MKELNIQIRKKIETFADKEDVYKKFQSIHADLNNKVNKIPFHEKME